MNITSLPDAGNHVDSTIRPVVPGDAWSAPMPDRKGMSRRLVDSTDFKIGCVVKPRTENARFFFRHAILTQTESTRASVMDSQHIDKYLKLGHFRCHPDSRRRICARLSPCGRKGSGWLADKKENPALSRVPVSVAKGNGIRAPRMRRAFGRRHSRSSTR